MTLSHFAHSNGGGSLPGGEADARSDRSPRTNLFLSAELGAAGIPSRAVRVRNLSVSGARIECQDPPPRGTSVTLSRSSIKVAAEIMWSDRASCGLRFAEPIDVSRWMSGRPGMPSAAPQEEPSLAADLALARQLVERLEQALSEQAMVVEVIGTELQALDLLVQLLRTSERRAGGTPAAAARSLRRAAATFLRQPPRPELGG